MHLTKPAWVVHENDKGLAQTIYSASVHPDGTRLATGALDGTLKLWTTAPLLDEHKQLNDEAVPKLLCTLTAHSGAVICVRWSNSGRFLASGADDNVVMIWGLDPSVPLLSL